MSTHAIPTPLTPSVRSCVYGLKLLPDWRLLTADHSGCVRLWNCRDLVGAARPTLTLQGTFAPSRDSPAAALVDEQVGAGGLGLAGSFLHHALTGCGRSTHTG